MSTPLHNFNVGVVIVTYNRSKVLLETLKRVEAQSFAPRWLCIVDNGSTDDTPNVLRELASQDASVSYVLHPQNIGFGGGLEIGINYLMKHFDPSHIWMMDDDSLPHKDGLALLVEHFNQSQYDLIGFTGYSYKNGKKFTLQPLQGVEDAEFILVDNALLTTSAVKKAGNPSAEFFMMCEDYEYCKRLLSHQCKVGVIPNDHVERLHLGSGTFSHATLWRGYYHSRNHLLILKEYYSFSALLHYLITQTKFLLGGLKAPDRWKRIGFRLRGIYDGLRSVKGKTLQPDSLKFIYAKRT